MTEELLGDFGKVLTAESVTPMVTYLCSEACTTTHGAYSAAVVASAAAFHVASDGSDKFIDHAYSGHLTAARPGTKLGAIPLIKPPYAHLTAIDLNKGDIVWKVPHGETPDNVKNHPALKGLTIPRTGKTGSVGTMVTKTLLVAGESGFSTKPSGERGAWLWAYDKATGKDAGRVWLSGPQSGAPMTYMQNGKQYIVVAVSNPSAEFLAFTLPGAQAPRATGNQQ